MIVSSPFDEPFPRMKRQRNYLRGPELEHGDTGVAIRNGSSDSDGGFSVDDGKVVDKWDY